MSNLGKALGLVLCLLSTSGAQGDQAHILDTSKEGMKAISEALGVKCGYCHPTKKADGKRDFAAPSEMKTVALFMKEHMVDKHVKKDGDPIDCAFCHQGKAKFVVRDTSQAKPHRLAGMPRREIVELMKGMQRGLGVGSCDHCHARGRDGRLDHTIPTENNVVTRQMMDHFTDQLLQLKNGKPATCESCHKSKTTFIPRPTAGLKLLQPPTAK
ncbi:MAG: hypothetical protein HOE48_07065 [Candidatus Latescibacteria bacterium]|jgi:hypothetical protein|nr:hypothetical protein [Candidatus Latescibacterota bacterium]